MALGATGTPAFFINGKNLRGAQPFPQFKAIIDAEIAEADKASKKGTAWIEERTKANNSKLPIRPIEEIKDEVERMCGGPPAKPKLGDRIVAAIKWVDGTVIDCVRAVGA